MCQDNKDFALLLNRMREGNMTEHDSKVLMLCQITPPDKALHLFLTNRNVDEFNSEEFKKSTTDKLKVIARDTLIGTMNQVMKSAIIEKIPSDTRKTGQLFGVLVLSVSLRYEIAVNVITEDGLTNGAACFIRQLCYAHSNATGVVWVEFMDCDVGTRREHRALYKSDKNPVWTPILPCS